MSFLRSSALLFLFSGSAYSLPTASVEAVSYVDSKAVSGITLRILSPAWQYAFLYEHDAQGNIHRAAVSLQTKWLRAGTFRPHGLYTRLRNPNSLHAWSSSLWEGSYFSLARGTDMQTELSAALQAGPLTVWIWQHSNWNAFGADVQLPLPWGVDLYLLALTSYPEEKGEEAWFHKVDGPAYPVMHGVSMLRYRNKYLYISTELYISAGTRIAARIRSLTYARVRTPLFSFSILQGYNQERYRLPGGRMSMQEWQASANIELHRAGFLLRYRLAYEKYYPEGILEQTPGRQEFEQHLVLQYRGAIERAKSTRERKILSNSLQMSMQGLIPEKGKLEYVIIFYAERITAKLEGEWEFNWRKAGLRSHVYAVSLAWKIEKFLLEARLRVYGYPEMEEYKSLLAGEGRVGLGWYITVQLEHKGVFTQRYKTWEDFSKTLYVRFELKFSHY